MENTSIYRITAKTWSTRCRLFGVFWRVAWAILIKGKSKLKVSGVGAPDTKFGPDSVVKDDHGFTWNEQVGQGGWAEAGSKKSHPSQTNTGITCKKEAKK